MTRNKLLDQPLGEDFGYPAASNGTEAPKQELDKYRDTVERDMHNEKYEQLSGAAGQNVPVYWCPHHDKNEIHSSDTSLFSPGAQIPSRPSLQVFQARQDWERVRNPVDPSVQFGGKPDAAAYCERVAERIRSS